MFHIVARWDRNPVKSIKEDKKVVYVHFDLISFSGKKFNDSKGFSDVSRINFGIHIVICNELYEFNLSQNKVSSVFIWSSSNNFFDAISIGIYVQRFDKRLLYEYSPRILRLIALVALGKERSKDINDSLCQEQDGYIKYFVIGLVSIVRVYGLL